MRNLENYLDEHNHIDMAALRKASAEREEEASARFHTYLGQVGKPDPELAKLMHSCAENLKQVKEEAAQRLIREEQEKANAEIESRIRKELNAGQETDLDRAYKSFQSALMSNHPTKGV